MKETIGRLLTLKKNLKRNWQRFLLLQEPRKKPVMVPRSKTGTENQTESEKLVSPRCSWYCRTTIQAVIYLYYTVKWI